MTAFLLKIIASACMLIDHVGAVFPASTPELFRLIGRIAFPIYAWMTAQGCKHTKDINKYLMRLGIFALISEIPFDIAFMHYTDMEDVFHPNINFLGQTNIFYTLFFGVSCVAVYEKLRTRQRVWPALAALLIIPPVVLCAILLDEIISWRIVMSIGFLGYLGVVLWLSETLPEKGADTPISRLRVPAALAPTIPIFLLGSIMGTDYGMYAIIYILVLYLAGPENRITRTITLACVVFFEYAYSYIYFVFDERYGIPLFRPPGRMMFYSDDLQDFWFAMIAVVLVFLYNGRQGPKIKWAFYIFYPLHISILAVLWFLLM